MAVETSNSRATVHVGDCLEILTTLGPVDAVVTDPPYHLQSIVKRFGGANAAPAKSNETGVYTRSSAGFMGQQWDGGDIAFDPATWRAVAAVMRPGAYLLAFGGTRGYHRMACAIEDAGFVLFDCLLWLYGSGFPKSHNLPPLCRLDGTQYGPLGTALKPAWEPIVAAFKPRDGTILNTVLEHGTGGMNIEDCRIEADAPGAPRAGEASQERRYNGSGATDYALKPGPRGGDPLGRWPANVCHDGSPEMLEAFAAFDAPGQQRAVGPQFRNDRTRNAYGAWGPRGDFHPRADTDNSAARFFYSAKADSGERLGSDHPTVKPLDLMRWLVRLVTPPGGLVLDPFAGTGTTGEAAIVEGRRCVLIEREPRFANDIDIRMKRATEGNVVAKSAAAARDPDKASGGGLPLIDAIRNAPEAAD